MHTAMKSLRYERLAAQYPPHVPEGEQRGPAEGSPAFVPPEEFDDYRIIRLLGRGATGSVFLAEDTVLARLVAIKFVAETDAEARQRFGIEARAAARLQHPNVVAIFTVNDLDGHPYLVSEFARGRTLAELDKPQPWERVLAIGIDLSRALAAAHRRGVLHCDIKAENAILTENDGAKLFDFGLATLVRVASRETGDGQTPTLDTPIGSIMSATTGANGTPETMAPEIWRGDPPTPQADVYSLGALLYQLCAGATPFHDIPLSALPHVVQRDDAPPLAQRAPAVDPRFAAILERCLRRPPEERYASGDELREALEQLARSAAGGGGSVPEGNPYRGLRPFDLDHRGLFFGRGTEIGLLVDRLRSESFVMVTGDSGVGKSSICRAGVVPAILDGALGGGVTYRARALVPGKHPRAALAAALGLELNLPADALSGWIDHDLAQLAREVKRALRTDGLILFLDQAEELITLSSRDEAESVDAALAFLSARVPGLRLLATVRADFLARFATLPALGEELPRALYFLRPLSPARIREVIVGPARATGVRFEPDSLVDTLVETTASAEGGLPLLQFALAELWAARDLEHGVIGPAALEALGGVAGALSRHGDTVLARMMPAQRLEARRMLRRLVTLENTRARRNDDELGSAVEPARGALDALIHARLIVAQDSESGAVYELAHEAILQGWTTLRRWLAEDAELRELGERLAVATAEWKRQKKARETLWGPRQLAEIARIDASDRTADERAFIEASEGAARRARRARWAGALAIPLLIAAVYVVLELRHGAELRRRVDAERAQSQEHLARAHTLLREIDALDARAFKLFDEQQHEPAEAAWAATLAPKAAAARELGDASDNLERAMAQDPERDDVRSLLADALYERALLAERTGRAEATDDLVRRFELYDPGGKLDAAWRAPGEVVVASDPPGAGVALLAYTQDQTGKLTPGPERPLGVTPLEPAPLPPGSYLLVFSAPDRAPVRYPLLVRRGEHLTLQAQLPRASEIPEGFVFVPAGRFLFGSTIDEDLRRTFFTAAPQHERTLPAYLIQRTEVTFASWISYLRDLPPQERLARSPRVGSSLGFELAVTLEEIAGAYQLTLDISAHHYVAREGQPLRYEGRASAVEQDWGKLPVIGVSGDDARAYTAWLDRTGRVPRARLCTELEWEKAARGADGRVYPHGSHLAPSDANFDETYRRSVMGPDQVGSHPASRSPLGLDDMSGNVHEWTVSSLAPNELVLRGGNYFQDRKTSRLENRNVSTASLHDTAVGLRICATVAAK
jgi:formylglycine-generating enzyme required for sulfatase activity